METIQRKMSVSATNHGFTIPAKFSNGTQTRHVNKGNKWAWVYIQKYNDIDTQGNNEKGILLLVPVKSSINYDVVRVQEMTLKRRGQPDRIQKKLNIPIELIRKYRLNTATCKITWVLTNKRSLHGEISLSNENIRMEQSYDPETATGN